MLAEILMLRVEAATREAARNETQYVPVTLPAVPSARMPDAFDMRERPKKGPAASKRD